MRRHYDAYNRGDLDALVATLAEDVVFESGDPQASEQFGGPYRGRQGVRGFFEAVWEQFSDLNIEVVKLEVQDDLVVASIYLHGRLKDTGLGGAIPTVHVFTVGDDGLITANRVFRQGQEPDPAG